MATKVEQLSELLALLAKWSGEYRAGNRLNKRQLVMDATATLSELKEIEIQEATEPSAPSTTPARVDPVLPRVFEAINDANNPFYRMGMAAAVAEALRISGRAMNVTEIWNVLVKHNFPTATRDPEHAVMVALGKLAKKKEVVRTLEAKWGLWNWYSESERNGFWGKNHSARTQRGVDLARSRGVHFGQPTKLTDDVRMEIERRVSEGEQLKAIAIDFDIHVGTLRRYYPKERLTELRALGAAKRQQDAGLN